MIKITSFLSAAMLFSALSATASDPIYVSPTGRDTGRGTAASPFATIQKAVDAAAECRGDSVEIVIGGGRYNITKPIEVTGGGRAGCRMVIRAAAGERVSVSGGVNVPLTRAVAVTDRAARERIQPEFRDNVRAIDLKKLGVEIADLHPVGFSRPSVPSWTELFVDEAPMSLSRFPNDTVLFIGKVHNTGNIASQKIYDRGGAVFEYNNDRAKRWVKAPKVWIAGYFAHGYADDMISLAAIDTVAGTMTTADDTHYGFMSDAAWRTWHALNLLEEIDRPGEYVLDAEAGMMYFYPPTDKMRQIDISVMSEPMMAIENTADVTVRGLTFEFARGMGVYMENTENVVVEQCTFRNLGNVGVCIGRGDMPSEGGDPLMSAERGGRSVSRLIGSLQGRLYDDILFNREGGHNNGVQSCRIYNVGAGGVNMGGGDRVTLEAAGNYVDNCEIYNYNRIERSYRGGVNVDGVGQRISHCEIYNAPSMAILMHGNDHLIEYCDIHNVCDEVDDQGAIYYGRDPSERTYIFRYNYLHDFNPKHRVTGFYHDDGACGSEVYGNVLCRAGSLPVLIGGGSDHAYTGNIFIDCPAAIHVDNRLQNWATAMDDKGGIFEKRLGEVKYLESPYKDRYPVLTQYFVQDHSGPLRCTVSGNLFYNITSLIHGDSKWLDMSNNWNTTEDPGFVDAAAGNFNLREDAPVFKMIRDFKAVPFDKIGLRR